MFETELHGSPHYLRTHLTANAQFIKTRILSQSHPLPNNVFQLWCKVETSYDSMQSKHTIRSACWWKFSLFKTSKCGLYHGHVITRCPNFWTLHEIWASQLDSGNWIQTIRDWRSFLLFSTSECGLCVSMGILARSHWTRVNICLNTIKLKRTNFFKFNLNLIQFLYCNIINK
jgi:hypothetical protein